MKLKLFSQKRKLASLIAMSMALSGCMDNETEGSNNLNAANVDIPAPSVSVTPVVVEDQSETVTTGTIKGTLSVGNISDAMPFIAGVSIRATRLDADSYTVQGASVQTASQRQEDGIYTTSTDSKGSFVLELPNGMYAIEAQGSATAKALKQVRVEADDTQTLDFVLTATGSIVGDICDETLNSCSGQAVYIPGTSYLAMTDDEGKFVISNVPVGVYTVVYTDYDEEDVGAEVSRSVKVSPGQNELGEVNASEPPSVVDTYFGRDEITPSGLDGFFGSINFSQSMDTEATEAAISFDKNIGELVFEWYNNDSYVDISVIASDNPGYGDTALVVSTEAKNANGLPLTEALFYDFAINERVAVWPQDGAEVYMGSPEQYDVYVYFSDSINRDSIELAVTPEVPGLLQQWDNQDSAIRLRGNFADSTEYTVSVTAATTVNGQEIGNLPLVSEFTTSTPAFVSSYPSNNTMEVDVDNNVNLQLNTPVNRDALESAITITAIKQDAIEGVTVEDFDIVWNYERDWDNYSHRGTESTREQFEIQFEKEVATTYLISVDLSQVTTLDGQVFGVEGETFTSEFTTLVPRQLWTSPNEGLSYNNDNEIYMQYNVQVDANNAIFTLVEKDSTTPIEIVNFESPDWDPQSLRVRHDILQPGTAYIFNYAGIKSDDYALADGKIEFTTREARVGEWSTPDNLATDVQLEHRVRLQFTVQVDETLQEKIENAISISPVDSDRAVSYIWNNNDWSNTSELFINYTFMPDTNYVIDFDTDEALNIQVEEGEGKVSTDIKFYMPITFSTVEAPETEEELSNINSLQFEYTTYQVGESVDVDPGYRQLQFNFKLPVNLDNDDVVLVDEQGNEEPVIFKDEFGNYQDYYQYCEYLGSKQFCKTNTAYVALEASSSYTLILKNQETLDIGAFCAANPFDRVYASNGGSEHCQDVLRDGWTQYQDQLPLELLAIETNNPRVYWWLDNINGMFQLQTDLGYYLKASEVESITFDPDLDVLVSNASDAEYGEEYNSDRYINNEFAIFRPEPFANILVNIPVLTVYERVETVDESTGDISVSFVPFVDSLGNNVSFEGSGQSQMRYVTADLQKPKLLSVSSTARTVIDISFNKQLDAATARDLDNYTLSCSVDGGDATSQTLVGTSINESAYYTDTRYALFVEDLPISDNTECTLSISGLLDFSGLNELPASSLSFETYKGNILAYMSDVFFLYDNGDDNTRTLYKTFFMNSDVALDMDSVENAISVKQMEGELAGTNWDFNEIKVSSDGMMYSLTFSLVVNENSQYRGNLELSMADVINTAGASVAKPLVRDEVWYSSCKDYGLGSYYDNLCNFQYAVASYSVEESLSSFYGTTEDGEVGTPFIILNTSGVLVDVNSLNADNFTIVVDDGTGTVGPVVTAVEITEDNHIKLSLSAPLTNWTNYQVRGALIKLDYANIGELLPSHINDGYEARDYFWSGSGSGSGS